MPIKMPQLAMFRPIPLFIGSARYFVLFLGMVAKIDVEPEFSVAWTGVLLIPA
jgi:hypothetical protein